MPASEEQIVVVYLNSQSELVKKQVTLEDAGGAATELEPGDHDPDRDAGSPHDASDRQA